ncbi:aspartic peptidase domain-containing protein [Mycena amicta]|nr:aspartic peptidase domain-containing protein [Mycena amicta]
MLASFLVPLLLLVGAPAHRLAASLSPVSLPFHLQPRDRNVSTVSGITEIYPSAGTWFVVLKAGDIYFRVALDTASADLWLVGSTCTTSSCTAVPRYPLDRKSSSFASVFHASYADGTAVSGFVATESIQLANITLPGQTFAIVTDCNLTLSDEVSGVLGLGFPRLSTISSASESTPFFPTLAQNGLLDYPLFGLSLADGGSGSLTLGAIDSEVVTNVSMIDWNPVVEFSPVAGESNTSSYLHWVISMSQFAVNTTRITPVPTYSKNTGNTTLALFDVGAVGIFGPYQDVERIFAKIDGSRLVADGLWAIPCDTLIPLTFTFGSQDYSMDPTEYLIGPASGNPDICLSWPMALRPSGDGIDWQFGIPFMRTVYSIFSYGIDTKEPPHLGFYRLKNMTESTNAANVSAFLSSISATVPTTLPNSLLPTPSISTPAYEFNTSIIAPTGGIVSSALATSTYSAIFGSKKSAHVTSLPVVSFVPDAHHRSVTTSTSTVQASYVLGPLVYMHPRLHILSFTLLLAVL